MPTDKTKLHSRWLSKRFILTVATMGAACTFLATSQLPPWPWVVTMLGAAAYHEAAAIISAFKDVLPRA